LFESRGGNIAHNGKSIGEGRATLLTIFKTKPTEAKNFFHFLKLGKN
jgi:hypothetical protein